MMLKCPKSLDMYLFSTHVVETEKIMTRNTIYLARILLLEGRAVLERTAKHGNTKCSQDLSCSLTTEYTSFGTKSPGKFSSVLVKEMVLVLPTHSER